MAQKKSIKHWLQQGIRRSSPALKIALLVMVICSTVALMVLGVGIHQIKKETEQLRQQAAQLEQDNEQLQQYIDGKDTIQVIIQLAREFLGLEDPDAIIIDPVQTTETQ